MLTRRDALAHLAALAAMAALPRSAWPFSVASSEPLDGTIADYIGGLRRGDWSAAEITQRALERCRTDGARLHTIDTLSRWPSSARRARSCLARRQQTTSRTAAWEPAVIPARC